MHTINLHMISQSNQKNLHLVNQQTQLRGWVGQMRSGGISFPYKHNQMIDEFAEYVICDLMSSNHGES